MVATGTDTTRTLRIVFFGTPDFAVPTLDRLLSSPHLVCGVVTQPDRPRGRGQRLQPPPVKAAALAHQVPVIQPGLLKDPEVGRKLREWRPDLGVVVAYGKILPESLLAIPRLGMINVHASLLPKYRGAAPVQRAVIAGERETGVTIMRVVKRLDAGPMLATARRPIAPDETSDVVERDLASLGAALLVDVVGALADGDVTEEAQDDTRSSYAPRLTKEEGLVDWSLPPTDIHNRVRGLYPWPHAYSFIDGARLILLASRVEPGSTRAAPGTVTGTSSGVIEVATGHEGRIAIVQVQPEGRRPMHAREFLAGHPVETGARFTDR